MIFDIWNLYKVNIVLSKIFSIKSKWSLDSKKETQVVNKGDL